MDLLSSGYFFAFVFSIMTRSGSSRWSLYDRWTNMYRPLTLVSTTGLQEHARVILLKPEISIHLVNSDKICNSTSNDNNNPPNIVVPVEITSMGNFPKPYNTPKPDVTETIITEEISHIIPEENNSKIFTNVTIYSKKKNNTIETPIFNIRNNGKFSMGNYKLFKSQNSSQVYNQIRPIYVDLKQEDSAHELLNITKKNNEKGNPSKINDKQPEIYKESIPMSNNHKGTEVAKSNSLLNDLIANNHKNRHTDVNSAPYSFTSNNAPNRVPSQGLHYYPGNNNLNKKLSEGLQEGGAAGYSSTNNNFNKGYFLNYQSGNVKGHSSINDKLSGISNSGYIYFPIKDTSNKGSNKGLQNDGTFVFSFDSNNFNKGTSQSQQGGSAEGYVPNGNKPNKGLNGSSKYFPNDRNLSKESNEGPQNGGADGHSSNDNNNPYKNSNWNLNGGGNGYSSFGYDQHQGTNSGYKYLSNNKDADKKSNGGLQNGGAFGYSPYDKNPNKGENWNHESGSADGYVPTDNNPNQESGGAYQYFPGTNNANKKVNIGMINGGAFSYSPDDNFNKGVTWNHQSGKAEGY